MGTVYRATHTKLDKLVALKVLPPDRLRDPSAVARFEREMRAVGRLEHPNIVRANDAGEANGTHFLVMEYVDGQDLSALVRQTGPLSVSDTLDVVRQAAQGLQYAHDNGLIHRDIKPSNLMRTPQGQLKILDLGLALLRAEESTGSGMTGEGQLMGTADYMAPEQATDAHNVDARADIYNLGCTLFFLLTGRPPYQERTAIRTFLAHREAPIPSLRQFRPDVSASLDAVCTKMLAKQPADRFASMSELLAALLSLQPDSPGDAAKSIAQSRVETFDGAVGRTSSETVVTAREIVAHESDVRVRGVQPADTIHRHTVLLGMSGRWIGIALGVIGLASIALLVQSLRVKTPAGTIVVEWNQADAAGAIVTVDEQHKLTLETGEGQEPIEVAADEKTHTLKVVKGGFMTYTTQFSVKAGGSKPIQVRLEPLQAETTASVADAAVSSPPSTDDPDRWVAERVIASGGAAWIGVGDQELGFHESGKALPPGDLRVSHLIFARHQPVDPDVLQTLPRLDSLTRLYLSETQVGDESMAVIERLRLEELTIVGTTIGPGAAARCGNISTLRFLTLGGNQFSRQLVDRLKSLDTFEDLNVNTGEISAEWIRDLAELSQLKSLALSWATFSPEAVDSLKELRHIRYLYLTGTPTINDATMPTIGRLTELERLGLSYTAVSSEGLQNLSGLAHLVILDLQACPNIDDRALEVLAGMKQLEWLNLYGVNVTDAGVRHLATLPVLTQLNLQKTHVTDASVETLGAMKTLTHLNLRETGITEQGIVHLRELLPNVTIE